MHVEVTEAPRIACCALGCRAWHSPEKIVRGRVIVSARCEGCFERLLSYGAGHRLAEQARAMYDAAERAPERPKMAKMTVDATDGVREPEKRRLRGLSAPLHLLDGGQS